MGPAYRPPPLAAYIFSERTSPLTTKEQHFYRLLDTGMDRAQRWSPDWHTARRHLTEREARRSRPVPFGHPEARAEPGPASNIHLFCRKASKYRAQSQFHAISTPWDAHWTQASRAISFGRIHGNLALDDAF